MPGRAAYLILDLENDLVHADGPNGQAPFGLEAARRDVLPKTARAIAAARERGALVGFVRTGFSDDYRECSRTSPLFSMMREYGLLKLGAWGSDLHPDLPVAPGDLQVVKHRISPFFGTPLDMLLRLHGIEHVFCSGVSTQAVVQACVRDAHDRDFRVTVLEDCCSASSQDEHDASIASLRMFASITSSVEAGFGQA